MRQCLVKAHTLSLPLGGGATGRRGVVKEEEQMKNDTSVSTGHFFSLCHTVAALYK